jgi:hypothetical protein
VWIFAFKLRGLDWGELQEVGGLLSDNKKERRKGECSSITTAGCPKGKEERGDLPMHSVATLVLIGLPQQHTRGEEKKRGRGEISGIRWVTSQCLQGQQGKRYQQGCTLLSRLSRWQSFPGHNLGKLCRLATPALLRSPPPAPTLWCHQLNSRSQTCSSDAAASSGQAQADEDFSMTDAVTGPFVVWADPVPNLRRGNAKLVTHVAIRALHLRPRLRIVKSCAMGIPVGRFRGLQPGWNVFLQRMA